MTRTIRIRAAIVAGTLLCFAAVVPAHAQDAPKEPPVYVTVRLRPDAKPETLAYLAKISKPQRVPTIEKETWAQLLRRIYGTSENAITALLRPTLGAVNPAADVPADEVLLPAGPRWAYNVPVEPSGTATVRQIAYTEMGVSGQKTRAQIEARNPHLRDLWDVATVEQFNLPYVTNWVTHELLPEFARKSEEVLAVFGGDLATLGAQIFRGFRLAPAWEVSAGGTSACPQTVGPQDWPFNTAPLSDPVAFTSIRGSATVAILDTGVAANDARFALWQNPSPVTSASELPTNTVARCFNDNHGCNFFSSYGFPADDATGAGHYSHGTHVAGLAAGLHASLGAHVADKIRLMILKVADGDGTVEPGFVTDAIDYARAHAANVVNMSFDGDLNPQVTSAVAGSPTMLFVAAAGNSRHGDGVNLNEKGVVTRVGFPARLSEEQGNMISVAAHDGNFQLSCFSNRGPQSVDLLAPGYDVESTILNGGRQKQNGTSQAAAVVSFAAALLHAKGLTIPSEIKYRLIASADYRPWLKDVVFSSGTLNIAKALRFEEDIVQLKDRVLYGRLRPMPFSATEDDEPSPIKLQEIYKIVHEEGAKGAQLTVRRKGRLVHRHVAVMPDIRLLVGKTEERIPAADIRDIVISRALHKAVPAK